MKRRNPMSWPFTDLAKNRAGTIRTEIDAAARQRACATVNQQFNVAGAVAEANAAVDRTARALLDLDALDRHLDRLAEDGADPAEVSKVRAKIADARTCGRELLEQHKQAAEAQS